MRIFCPKLMDGLLDIMKYIFTTEAYIKITARSYGIF